MSGQNPPLVNKRTYLEELDQVVELAVHVAADRHRRVHELHVRLLLQDLHRLLKLRTRSHTLFSSASDSSLPPITLSICSSIIQIYIIIIECESVSAPAPRPRSSRTPPAQSSPRSYRSPGSASPAGSPPTVNTARHTPPASSAPLFSCRQIITVPPLHDAPSPPAPFPSAADPSPASPAPPY